MNIGNSDGLFSGACDRTMAESGSKANSFPQGPESDNIGENLRISTEVSNPESRPPAGPVYQSDFISPQEGWVTIAHNEPEALESLDGKD